MKKTLARRLAPINESVAVIRGDPLGPCAKSLGDSQNQERSILARCCVVDPFVFAESHAQFRVGLGDIHAGPSPLFSARNSQHWMPGNAFASSCDIECALDITISSCRHTCLHKSSSKCVTLPDPDPDTCCASNHHWNGHATSRKSFQASFAKAGSCLCDVSSISQSM